MSITNADHHRIEAAARAVEARAGVHIATAIVPASDRYALYPVVWGALATLAVGGLLAFAWPELGLRKGFALEALLFVVLSIVLDWWPLRVRLAPRRVRHAHASAMAHREFAARILSSGKSGLLLFVSLGERYAEVIADRAVHARVGTEAWNRIVGRLVSAASRGQVVEGVLEALTLCDSEITGRG